MADTTAVEVKPGWTTTEWIGTLVVHLLSAAIVVLGAFSHIPWVQVVSSIAGAILSFIQQRGYATQRVEVKATAAANALSLVRSPPALPPVT